MSVLHSFLILPLTNFGRCLEHVVNLADVAVISHITKLAAIENSTAMWEYDPLDPDNCVLEGSLDVITAIRTLTIKVCFVTQILYTDFTIAVDPSLRTVY